MKFFCFVGLLLLISGCNKIADWATPVGPDTEQTGDPVYDNQNEIKVMVPWDWVMYDFKNTRKKSTPIFTE